MSWTIESSDPRPGGERSAPDIVIRGFEKGVADGALNGLQDMRNVNIISSPGEAMVSLKTATVPSPTALSAVEVTFTGSTDVVNYASASANLYTGQAITFGLTAGGVTASRVYWVGSITSTTFKVYTNIALTTPVNLSDSGNNFTSITMSQPKWGCNNTLKIAASTQNGYQFIQDSSGAVWWVNDSGNLIFIGPLNSATGVRVTSNASGNGVVVLGGWLLAFRENAVDLLSTDEMTSSDDPTYAQWINDWESGLVSNLPTPGTGLSIVHQGLVGRDNTLYFCNGQNIGSVLVIGTFDPTNTNTYVDNSSALLLPVGDRATHIAELGNLLLIGGTKNSVYTWDRVNPGINNILLLAESYTTRIVSTNANSYIFAGNRGRIYITNGSNVELYKKFPDSIANVQDPYYTWYDAVYWRNQIYFGLSATTNAGTAISTVGSLWAIDITTEALRMTNSFASTASSFDSQARVILPDLRSTTPGGAGLFIGWQGTFITTVYGVDVSTTTPYSSTTSTYIVSDLIPVGTFFAGRTFQQVEYKFSRELVSGESIAIGWRTNLNDSFTSLTSTSTQLGAMSGTFGNTIDTAQFLQLQIGLASTDTSPSYCPLVEVRIR